MNDDKYEIYRSQNNDSTFHLFAFNPAAVSGF